METLMCAQRPPAAAAARSIWMAEKVVQTPIAKLRAYENASRSHSAASIAKLKASVARFGFVIPILIDAKSVIIAGHGRYEAAKALGLATVPTIEADHLTHAEARALRIADNRLAELSDWNESALRIEFDALMELKLDGAIDFGPDITGFEMPQIEIYLAGANAPSLDPAETVEDPDPDRPPVTRLGDLWILNNHRIFCGDAREAESYAQVLQGDAPRMVFTDPPYNVAVQGHVRCARNGGHREFAMASGEMSEDEFRQFLRTIITRLLGCLSKGSIAMICIDWRHVADLIVVGEGCGLELINLCVWNKTNGGMGSLYRSKHELVCVFKKPGAPHINNVELGRHGRNRTNVWDYAGVNSFGSARSADLVDHPTVKPTAMVADAIMDVSQRGDIVLDAFGGSGATLLAAERTGRQARLIELDPAYVDVAIRRWKEMTGEAALHATTGESFDQRQAALSRVEEDSHV
jgi:DNA modification methylase